MATDVELLTAIGQALEALLPADWRVVQNFQPTGQARHSDTTVYFSKMGDQTAGFPARDETWDAAAGRFAQRHSQVFVSTFRVQGFANRDDPDAPLTPSDVTARASLALQTDHARERLLSVGAQPLRVVNLPSFHAPDERDRWEEVSTFDFLVSHSRVMVLETPAATLGPVKIHSV